MASRLDTLDLKLMSCLQEDNQLSADVLAERVGRSPSAIARRLRRLRETGAIAKDVSVIADRVVGNPLFAIINVQLERHALNEAEAFRRRLAASENVQLYLEVSGTFDIVLLVAVIDMTAFVRFAEEMLEGDQTVRRYETSFVKRRIKASLALPLAQLVE